VRTQKGEIIEAGIPFRVFRFRPVLWSMLILLPRRYHSLEYTFEYVSLTPHSCDFHPKSSPKASSSLSRRRHPHPFPLPNPPMDLIAGYGSDRDSEPASGNIHIMQTFVPSQVLLPRPASATHSFSRSPSSSSPAGAAPAPGPAPAAPPPPHQGRVCSFPHVEGNYATHVHIKGEGRKHAFSSLPLSGTRFHRTLFASCIFSPGTVAPPPDALTHLRECLAAVRELFPDLQPIGGPAPAPAPAAAHSLPPPAKRLKTAAPEPPDDADTPTPGPLHLSLSRAFPVRYRQIDPLLCALRDALAGLMEG
jgi:hypothetical protein